MNTQQIEQEQDPIPNEQAYNFLKKCVSEYAPFTNWGLNQLPYVLYDAVAKAMQEYASSCLKEQGGIKWETFCDVGYYGLWAVRPIGDSSFESQKLFHVQTKEEALALTTILNQSPSTPSDPINKTLMEALRELVELKRIKDTLLKKEYLPSDENYSNWVDYLHRKELAWEAARKALENAKQ